MKNLLKKIQEQVNSLDVDELNEIICLLEAKPYMEYKNEIMEILFSILENNPDEDFGIPGEIVHFLEKFYKNGYEEKLVESLNRKPTSHTVWMLNRIINDTENESYKIYQQIMVNLLNRNDVESDLKDEISDFLN